MLNLKDTIELYAPFLTNYWRHMLSIGVAFLIALCFLRISKRRERRVEALDKSNSWDEAIVQDSTANLDYDSFKSEEESKQIPYQHPHVMSEKEMMKKAQDFYNFMNQRRSLRFFSKERVPSLDTIKTIIHTGSTGPSGAHMQPWTFVVISNMKVKCEVKKIVEDEEKINYQHRMGSQWVNALKPLNTNWCKPYLEDAPYLILIFEQVYKVTPDGKQPTYYNEISTCIATGILLAAIHYAGLVTVTTTPLNCGSKLRVLLERPVNEKLLVLLPVGFPAPDATVPDLKRKSLEEVMVHI